MKMPKIIADELDKIDRNRWSLEYGGRRYAKLKIDGRLIAVTGEAESRATLNVRSQIRRHLNANAN